jgi:mycothiol system anti-sigma-R factor
LNWIDELRRLLLRARGEQPVHAASCREAVEKVVEWLDGELDAEDEQRIGRHLEACARCFPAVRFERAFREALERAAGVPACPESVREGVVEALKERGFGSG